MPLVQDGKKIIIRIEGYNYDYVIHLTEDYMGAYLNSKAPHAGEDWIRGNDLSDGKPTAVTWNKIVRDILKNELK